MLMDCMCGVGIEAKLDPNKDVVVCMECDRVIETTPFMRATMKTNHDVLDIGTVRIPPNGLLTTCGGCNRDFSAELDRKKDVVICPLCQTEAKLNMITLGMLRTNRIFVGATKDHFENEGKTAMTQEEIDEQESLKGTEENEATVIELGTAEEPVTEEEIEIARSEAQWEERKEDALDQAQRLREEADRLEDSVN